MASLSSKMTGNFRARLWYPLKSVNNEKFKHTAIKEINDSSDVNYNSSNLLKMKATNKYVIAPSCFPTFNRVILCPQQTTDSSFQYRTNTPGLESWNLFLSANTRKYNNRLLMPSIPLDYDYKREHNIWPTPLNRNVFSLLNTTHLWLYLLLY